MEIHKINATFYRVVWKEDDLIADFTKIRDSRDSLIAELRVYSEKKTKMGYDLALCNLNLLSSIAKTKLAKELTGKHNSVNWQQYIEQSTIAVVDKYREGEPIETISSTDEVENLQYKLWPFLLKGQPTMFFGGGGSGKSYLALFFALCIKLGWQDNFLGLHPEQGEPMYLDWETDKQTIMRRLKMIYPDKKVNLSYRRCSLPLVDDIENIQSAIYRASADTIIIDSLGVACGGDMNSAEITNRFYGALRTLPVTSLLITHTSKSELGKKSAYGSVYWSNLARSVWEVCRSEESQENETIMGLRHTKSNESRLHSPMAVKLIFDKNKVIFNKINYSDIADLLSSLPIKTRILNLLKKGMKTTKEIAEELDAKYDAVRITANRLEKQGKLIKIDKAQWALLDREHQK